jgi:hypothetical protein
MDPWYGTIGVLAECMGVLGDIDTYVSRHGCNAEKLQSGLGIPQVFRTSENPLAAMLGTMLNQAGACK